MIQNPKSKIPKLYLIILMLVGVLGLVFTHTDVIAWYSVKYADSAHGNTSYGVKRSDAPADEVRYHRASCAHCHDTFDQSICGVNELMLFAPMNQDSQTDNFCFQCHKESGSVQVDGITNKDYSHTFGGALDPPDFDNIYDAFNTTTGSSHNLADVLNHALKFSAWQFNTNDNACIVCHNPHIAQKNYPVMVNAMGGVNTAVRRPGQHDDADTNLWGDEPKATSGWNEMMSDKYGELYQAPYRVDKTTYEPAGDSTQDGSNLPNFTHGFCLPGCHQRSDVYSTDHGRNLYAVNWTTSGEYQSQHGQLHVPESGEGWTISPYDAVKDYVLSCLDCHEPHGSPNKWLLRTCVNGKDNISVTDNPDDWYEFCTACHAFKVPPSSYHIEPPNAAPSCDSCHGHHAGFF